MARAKRAPGLAQAIDRALKKEAEQAPPVDLPAEFRLTVYGHAKPSVRITNATKWAPEARAYLAWQKFVGEHCVQLPRPIPWQRFRVDMLFYFADDNHGDRINLGKSTEDGLAWGKIFPRRRLKSGRLSKNSDDSCIHDGNVGIRWCEHAKDERVEITITEFKSERREA